MLQTLDRHITIIELLLHWSKNVLLVMIKITSLGHIMVIILCKHNFPWPSLIILIWNCYIIKLVFKYSCLVDIEMYDYFIFGQETSFFMIWNAQITWCFFSKSVRYYHFRRGKKCKVSPYIIAMLSPFSLDPIQTWTCWHIWFGANM